MTRDPALGPIEPAREGCPWLLVFAALGALAGLALLFRWVL